MQINEAKIFNFGKLQEQKFRFEPGINVIYGPNEAGKTTLHAFLLAMLFGMDKSRRRIASGNMYQQYEPWHAPAYYSGALRFSVDGRPFYLERNFYHREKREILRNEADGEELSVAYGDLTMLLGGIGREAFGNTYDIPQSGAATGKELADILTEYLSDASEGGDGSLHVSRAVSCLEQKKKKLNDDLKKIREQKEQEKKELQIEQEILEGDCAALRTQLGHLEQEWKILREKQKPVDNQHFGEEQDKGREPQPVKANRGARFMGSGPLLKIRAARVVCCALFLLGLFINWGIFHILPYEEHIFWMLQGILGVSAAFVFILGALGRKTASGQKQEEAGAQSPRQEELCMEPEEELRLKQGEALARKQVFRMQENIRELLQEKETRLYNIKERLLEQGTADSRELRLAEDIAALTLAASELQRLSAQFCETLEEELGREASRYVSLFTGGKYDSIKMEASGAFTVLSEGREIPPEMVSRGTLEQFYLALRLAVGDVIAREEKMPIFLDEAFSMYDDERLKQTLGVIGGLGHQIFLFTCQKRELELLGQLGITYHRVNLF